MNMVTNRYMLLKAVALAITLAAFSAAQAGPGRDGHNMNPEQRLKMMKKHLGLSDQQVTQIRAIQKKHEPQHKQLREKMREKRKELHALLMSESPDRSAVLAKMQEASAVKIELRMHRFDMHQEVHAILNPAQRAKMRKHMEERMKHHREGRGKGKGKGGRR